MVTVNSRKYLLKPRVVDHITIQIQYDHQVYYTASLLQDCLLTNLVMQLFYKPQINS